MFFEKIWKTTSTIKVAFSFTKKLSYWKSRSNRRKVQWPNRYIFSQERLSDQTMSLPSRDLHAPIVFSLQRTPIAFSLYLSTITTVKEREKWETFHVRRLSISIYISLPPYIIFFFLFLFFFFLSHTPAGFSVLLRSVFSFPSQIFPSFFCFYFLHFFLHNDLDNFYDFF